MSGVRTDSGRRLNKQWGVGAQHALYHKDGSWYMPLERFPGAYFDPYGYILFRTQKEYKGSSHLSIGMRVQARGGISRMPGYHQVK